MTAVWICATHSSRLPFSGNACLCLCVQVYSESDMAYIFLTALLGLCLQSELCLVHQLVMKNMSINTFNPTVNKTALKTALTGV